MAESCHTAAKKGGVSDEDGGPAELLCIEDATTADLIGILRTAGIDDDVGPVNDQSMEATHDVPTLPGRSPLTETDDENLVSVKVEATQETTTAHESRKRIHWEESIDSSVGPMTTPADSDVEDEVDEEYLNSLYDAHIRRRRIMLSTPSFKTQLVPVVPSEVDQFFNAFRHMSLAQQQQQFKALRDTHHEYIADLELRRGQPVNPASPSLVENTQGSGSSSSGAHHVPPTGVEYWAAIAGDDRNLVGRRKGNLQTPGASHSTIDLRQNRAAAVPINDRRAYKWLIVPALGNPIRDLDTQVVNSAYRLATTSPMQDTSGTIPFTEFMSQFEPYLKQHLGEQYLAVSWRERWREIVNGGHSISFKFIWLQTQYDQVASYPPFTANWWQHVPTPLRLKFIGSSAVDIAPEARGVQLPHEFTGTLVHYTCRKHLPSITRWGLMCGRKCSQSGEKCIYLAAVDWNQNDYTA